MTRAERAEAAIAEVGDRFPDWEPTPAMLGYARACLRAYPEAPLPGRAAAYIDASIGRLDLASRNEANDVELRTWCLCIAGDLRKALTLLGFEP